MKMCKKLVGSVILHLPNSPLLRPRLQKSPSQPGCKRHVFLSAWQVHPRVKLLSPQVRPTSVCTNSEALVMQRVYRTHVAANLGFDQLLTEQDAYISDGAYVLVRGIVIGLMFYEADRSWDPQLWLKLYELKVGFAK